jgi:tetratricopeptide (TPR) repeat protein
MLHLLTAPHWLALGQPEQPVPATLPGCLLVYLAAQGEGRGGWVDRERLAALFWPERAAGAGLHNLRVNLNRLRNLLASWGLADALGTDRTRVRLALPTDLAQLAAALAVGAAVQPSDPGPGRWLQGFRIAGFGEFWAWADQERQHWLQLWLAAAERALVDALQQDRGEPALALFTLWQAAGGVAMPALDRLDPATLPPAARATWQHLRARLPAIERGPERGQAPVRDRGADAVRALPGRRSEQDALRASQAAALVLLGEPGAGKTSLLTSCWPGAPVLHGREGLHSVPFAPVLEWLQGLRERLPALLRTPATQLGAYRLDLARLLPDLAPDEPLPPLDAHTAKARLLEALARLTETQGPLLLVDDLQWIDPATLEWLVFVAHRGRQRWRASARPHELTGPVRQTLDALRAARLLETQSIDGLDRAALAEVCRRRWPGRDCSDAVLDGLHQASAGNPFVLGELMTIGADHQLARGEAVMLPRRVQDVLVRRLQSLSAGARAVVEAAAVLVRPTPPALLAAVLAAAGEGLDEAAVWQACQEAVTADLLRKVDGGLQCRHDLIRSAAASTLGTVRRPWLHRRAALALGALPQPEPLVVAGHWRAAQEPQTALAWMHRGALQQKERGRFDDACALWQRVAEESFDATQALRARLALAECDLFHDLAKGRTALQLVLDQVGAVADALQRAQIEGQVLAGLVDNAVFSGDLAQAAALAPRLRELLPRLHVNERVQALEVLIELAMREPDIAAAWALLEQVRRLAPRRPSSLSFEGQIHWFGGDARAARDAFEALLAAHPDYCCGLTIENDLAVMLSALGELDRAELMVRRSLASWQGVAHTEALSLLVLGSVLTSAGRHAEAMAALDQALLLARAQSSGLFEAEALVRRARLWLQCGHFDQALADLDQAAPWLQGSGDPLRVSHYALTRVLTQLALGQPPERSLAERVRIIGLRSAHPLLHARLARIELALALAVTLPNGQPGPRKQVRAKAQPGTGTETSTAAAERLIMITREAGLLEPLAEALLLRARLSPAPQQALPLLLEAAALADAQGFADVGWRAHAGLAAATGRADHRRAADAALQRLIGADPSTLFDAGQAARREPWPAATT